MFEPYLFCKDIETVTLSGTRSIFTVFQTENKTINAGQPFWRLRCSLYEKEGNMPEAKRKTPKLPDDEIARKLEFEKL
ncbi:hypothetical protein WY51_17700 [Salmonella enterica subsp. enterica serovar Braenderup]|nr:hypothetical protein [Salmonella enterica subsp. enterica serovar Braenderup]